MVVWEVCIERIRQEARPRTEPEEAPSARRGQRLTRGAGVRW